MRHINHLSTITSHIHPILLFLSLAENFSYRGPAEGRRFRESLVSFESELMVRYEANSMVNSPRNVTPACAKRVVSANSLFSGV
jgi:hypothetical protein